MAEAFGSAALVVDENLADPRIPIIQPTIGQFIAALDGMDVQTKLGNVRLETAMDVTLDDGTDAVVSSVDEAPSVEILTP